MFHLGENTALCRRRKVVLGKQAISGMISARLALPGGENKRSASFRINFARDAPLAAMNDAIDCAAQPERHARRSYAYLIPALDTSRFNSIHLIQWSELSQKAKSARTSRFPSNFNRSGD